MKLSELVEAKAREAATECGAGIFCTAEEFAFRVGLAKYAIIATLNECGFREALERGRSLSKAGDSLFHEIDELMGDTDPIEDDDATLACQEWWKALHEFESIAAETKLAELQEMEKGI